MSHAPVGRAVSSLALAFLAVGVARGQCLTDVLEPPQPVAGGKYGLCVALANDVALVSAQLPAASVHVYERPAVHWVRTAELTSVHPTQPGEHTFGQRLATDGATLLVGHGGAAINGPASGSAHFYERRAAGWNEVAEVQGGIPFERLGNALALDGDDALVGAPSGTSLLSPPTGSVYVFSRSTGSWIQTDRLFPATPGVFGLALALDGPRALITGSGTQLEVFVHEKSGGTWQQTSVLRPPASVTSGFFGAAVALEGDVAAVTYNASGTKRSVFVYEYAAGQWELDAELMLPSAMVTTPRMALELEDGRLAVESTKDKTVFVFEKRCGEWVKIRELPLFGFGNGMGWSGNLMLVGTPQGDPPGFSSQPGKAVFGSIEDSTCIGALLRASTKELPWNLGGAQELELQGSAFRAGGLYWLLGSASGTVPGNDLLGIGMPLNVDNYFLFTASFPGASLLAGAVGFLDSDGCAETRFELPAGPSLVGVRLNHAYLLGDWQQAFPEVASNPVAVSFFEEVTLFEEDFESGAAGWDFGVLPNLWHLAPAGECGAVSSMAAYGAGPASCNYVFGLLNGGDLLSPTFAAAMPTLTVQLTTRAVLDASGHDLIELALLNTTSGKEFVVASTSALVTGGAFEPRTFALPDNAAQPGDQLRLRLRFAAAIGGNDTLGWQVDDLRVTAHQP